MKTDAYLATLVPADWPVFMQSLGGFAIPTRLGLGCYPDSYEQAVQALAGSHGANLKETND